MKNLLILLCFVAVTGFADTRIDLSTSTCQAALTSWDANKAHEFTCSGNSFQKADGTRNAFYEGWYLTNQAGLGDSEPPEPGEAIFHEADCSVVPGVFKDSDENVYETKDCRVYLAYRYWAFSIEKGRPVRYRVDAVIELNGLEPAREADDDDDDEDDD